MENFDFENCPKKIKYKDLGEKKVFEAKYDSYYLFYLMLLTLIWICFFTVFTGAIFQCSECSKSFIFFVIPFWAIIIFNVVYTVKVIFGKIEIVLSKDKFQIIKYIGKHKSIKIYNWSEIKDFKLVFFKI